MEHGFQLFFESLVFGALVEFADEMTSNFEGVMGEIEGGAAEVLQALVLTSSVGREKAHHATSMVFESIATGVHHPVIRVTQAPLP